MPALNALTRLDAITPETPAPSLTRCETQPARSQLPPLRVVLQPHQVGTEGPWWVDVRAIEDDGTEGMIVFSSAFAATREAAVALGWAWMGRRQVA